MPFRNYYKKHTRTADHWPLRKVHRSETRHPGLALVPDTHTEKSDSWLNAFRNYYKKHTRTDDLLPFQRLHRSETRHTGLALVPDTHTEKSASWLIAFRNYWRKDSFPPFSSLNFTDCLFGSLFWPGENKSQSPVCPVSKNWKSGCVRLYTVWDPLARVEVLEELHFYRLQKCEISSVVWGPKMSGMTPVSCRGPGNSLISV